jgi:hypothetical protein
MYHREMKEQGRRYIKKGMRKQGRRCIKGNEETGEEMRELGRICIKGELGNR